MAGRRGLVNLSRLIRTEAPLFGTSRTVVTLGRATNETTAPLAAFQGPSSRLAWASWKLGFASDAADNNNKDQQQEASAAAADAGQPETPQQEQEQQEQETEDPLANMSADELRAELVKTQESAETERKRADELKENLLRTLADMENLRDRTARQASEARQFAVQGLVKSLVEVADNLERAAGSVSGTLDAVEAGGPKAEEVDRQHALKLLKSLRDGVLLTDSILMRILGEYKVERYDPMGEKLDPNMHNALFELADGTKEPGTVGVVIKKGYKLHDRVVRAADVGVVKAD